MILFALGIVIGLLVSALIVSLEHSYKPELVRRVQSSSRIRADLPRGEVLERDDEGDEVVSQFFPTATKMTFDLPEDEV